MTQDIAQRLARETDVVKLLALLDEAGLPTLDITPNLMGDFIVAEDAQRIVGCVGLQTYSEVALLRSLAVAPAFQGRQIGTLLLGAIETHAQAQGVRILYLLTTTAGKFFLQNGYQTCSRRTVPSAISDTREFADICPDSAECFARRLDT